MQKGKPSAERTGVVKLNLGLDSDYLQTILEDVYLDGDFADKHHKKAAQRETFNRFKTLEDLSDEQLKALVNSFELRLDELVELRGLEQSLRESKGDYRGRN